MQLAELHRYLFASMSEVIAPRYSDAVRALLESRSAELFLTDLLYCSLHEEGHPVSRELPIGGRQAADIVLHGDAPICIEAKQLHLKDGGRFAPTNLAADLARHDDTAIGVMYILDERASSLPLSFYRFSNANRKASSSMDKIHAILAKHFEEIYPASPSAALLKTFRGQGQLDLYAFVLKRPRVLAARDL